MAQELEDGEFWLPPDFLTDVDDLLTDCKASPLKTKATSNCYSHGFGFNSDLSSPADSVIGSAEIESDEDDFIARKIAKSSIHDSNFFSDNKLEGWKLSSSPKSTLCACKQGSTLSSPNSVSRVSTPTGAKDAVAWDLVQAAAGEEVERTTSFYSTNNLFASAPIHSPVYPTQTHAQAHLAYLQLQAKTFQQMQHQQQMINRRDWGKGKIEPQCRRNQGLSMAAWPTLQQSQQPRSGMRAVFLGDTDGKKERIGTGVFLPRSYGPNPTGTRKKSGYSSTVLLPEHVVHALNLNVDSIDAKSQLRGNKNFVPKYGSVVADQRQLVMNQATRPA